MLNKVILGTAIGACLMLTQFCAAGPQPGVPSSEWVADNPAGAQVGYGVNAVTVLFTQLGTATIPPDTFVRITAGGDAQASLFTGDYTGAGVKGVTLKASATGATPRLYVFLEDEVGRRWYLSEVSAPVPDSGIASSNLSFDRRAGWFTLSSKNSGDDFARVLANVSKLGVELVRTTQNAHSCTISDVRLLLADEVVTPSAVLSATVESRFGVSTLSALNAAQRLQDSDGDGITDVQEIMITETDPDDANSALDVNIVAGPNGEYEMSWNAVAGGKYRILRAAGAGMSFVAVAETQTDTNGRGKYVDSAAGIEKCFYRVQQVK